MIGVGYLLTVLVKRKKVFIDKNTWAIVLFISISFVSLISNNYWLNNNELFIAFLYLCRFISYALLYIYVKDFSPAQKKHIVSSFVVIGGIVVFLGFVQYIFYNNLRNLFYLGWDEHMYRMFSVFFDPNYFGSFLVLYFLFLFGYYFENKNQKNIIIILLFFTLLAILLTFSRSALLMLIVSVSMLCVMLKVKRLLILFGSMVVIFIIFASSKFYIENINLLRTVSTYARIESSQNALVILKENPFLGVGFNAYRYAQIKYNLRSENTQIASHADAGSDNSLFFVGATTGIIGFIAYVYMYSRFLLFSKTIYKKEKNILALVVYVSLVALLINSFFINSLFYPFIMYWVWILLGVIANK